MDNYLKEQLESAIHVKRFEVKQSFIFLGSFLVGGLITLLTLKLFPSIRQNEILSLALFPIVTFPLIFLILLKNPKCRECGNKTKTKKEACDAYFHYYECLICGQLHKSNNTD